jgi:hypothetical protein
MIITKPGEETPYLDDNHQKYLDFRHCLLLSIIKVQLIPVDKNQKLFLKCL